MKKYRVCGVTTVTVYKEVWANNEDEAMDKANYGLSSLTAFCGNGGTDKLIGVYEYNESVAVDDYIEWNDTEILDDDPDYFECPECNEQCEHRADVDGEEYWYCENCCQCYDDDGEVVYPDAEEEEN